MLIKKEVDKKNNNSIGNRRKVLIKHVAIGLLCFIVGYIVGNYHLKKEIITAMTDAAPRVNETFQDATKDLAKNKQTDEKISKGFDGFEWSSTPSSIIQSKGNPSVNLDFVIEYHNVNQKFLDYAIDSVSYNFEGGMLWLGTYKMKSKSINDFESITAKLSSIYGTYSTETSKVEIKDSSNNILGNTTKITNTYKNADGSSVSIVIENLDKEFSFYGQKYESGFQNIAIRYSNKTSNESVGQIEVADSEPMEAIPVALRTGEQVYQAACFACHDSGALDAPKKGDAAAWKPRLAKGLETLHRNAIDGFRAMPPRGTCYDCSDDDILNAIDFMTSGI